MKKFFKKVACLLISGVFVISASACSGGLFGSNSDALSIRVANVGFGTNWLYSIADAFEQIYDCEVEIKPTVIIDEDLIKVETDYQMEDLIFSDGTGKVDDVIRAGKVIPIDDVWADTPEGEDETIEDKIWRDYNLLYKDPDGHYYSMPSNISLGGLAYNKTSIDKVLGEGNWELPTTTDEVLEIANRMKEAGHWGFSWSTLNPYWSCLESWASQYNGIEASNYLHDGYYYDSATEEWKFSQRGECLDQDIGKLRMYEAIYEMIHKEYGLSSTYCSSMNYMQCQAAFAGMGYKPADSRLVAFCPNGNWLYEESQLDFEYTKSEIGFFVPVISAIVEKCSFYEEKGTDYYTLSEAKRKVYDDALSEIIRGLQAGQTITTVGGFDVTAADIELIEEAMKLRATKTQSKIIIPKNARHVELAKEFLKFFASDYAGQIYSRVTHAVSPFYYDVVPMGESATLFDRDSYEMLKTGEVCGTGRATPLSYAYGLKFEAIFFDSDDKNINTPTNLWAHCNKQNKNNWKNLVILAGLKDLLEE